MILLRSWWFVIATISTTFGQFEDDCGVSEGEDVQFSFTYTPLGGDLFSVTWYNGTAGTANDLILFYLESSGDITYYNGYTIAKAEFIPGINSAGIIIYSAEQSDIADYRVTVSHGGRIDGFFTLPHVITTEDLSQMYLTAGDTNYTTGNYSVPMDMCAALTLNMPDMYPLKFNVTVVQNDKPSFPKSYTCSGSPCQLPVDTSDAQTVDVILDLLLCEGDPMTFRFICLDQTTTPTDSTPTTDTLGTDDTVNTSIPTTGDQVTTTITPESDGLDLWIIIVIVVACVLVVIIITIPVVLCCCRKPQPKVNGQNTHHEDRFSPPTPREYEDTDPSTGVYGRKPATGLPTEISGDRYIDGRSPEYLNGPVGVTPVVFDVHDRSKNVFTAQGYENQGYDYPPPDYDQHGQSHVSRVNVY